MLQSLSRVWREGERRGWLLSTRHIAHASCGHTLRMRAGTALYATVLRTGPLFSPQKLSRMLHRWTRRQDRSPSLVAQLR